MTPQRPLDVTWRGCLPYVLAVILLIAGGVLLGIWIVGRLSQ